MNSQLLAYNTLQLDYIIGTEYIYRHVRNFNVQERYL